MENQTMMQFFEWYLPADALLWKRVAAQGPRLKQAGIDIVWLPPAMKGAGGVYDTGYGVYDLYDLGEFDQKGSVGTKYGTKQEYVGAVRALQKTGIAVLADIVLNHRMGADEKQEGKAYRGNPQNRNEDVDGPLDIAAWTKYICPGRAGKYSPFNWEWQCFTGVDWDENSRQGGVYRLEGKQWNPRVDSENGNYDYLMGADVDFQNDAVTAELTGWGRWYLDETGVDGFRLDALKHIDHDFFPKWLYAMRQHAGKGLFSVGEYWNPDPDVLVDYLNRVNYSMSLFDVPLHFQFYMASHAGGNFDMSGLLSNALVSREIMHAVTFVDNHDSQPGQGLESWVEEWFKPLAYAVILLRRDGLPCVFYADYYGMRGDGVAPVPGLKRMLQVRKAYAYGEQRDYFDHPDIVGWTRAGDARHKNSGCAVLVTDRDAGEKTMYIGTKFAGQRFRDVIRRVQEPVIIGEDGNAQFKVAGGGVSVWVTEAAYENIVVHYE